ncbi:hypothetical protein T08_14733 [Trichinella sp. T8]|nr:hypothetical protein T08_14733 [Trichinella sp. T8]
MVDIIQENCSTTRLTFYFDNFFNNYDLLLLERYDHTAAMVLVQ